MFRFRNNFFPAVSGQTKMFIKGQKDGNLYYTGLTNVRKSIFSINTSMDNGDNIVGSRLKMIFLYSNLFLDSG